MARLNALRRQRIPQAQAKRAIALRHADPSSTTLSYNMPIMINWGVLRTVDIPHARPRKRNLVKVT